MSRMNWLGLRTGFPFAIVKDTDPAGPEIWDGSTFYIISNPPDEDFYSPSNSSDKQTKVCGNGTSNPVGLTWAELQKWYYRIRKGKLSWSYNASGDPPVSGTDDTDRVGSATVTNEKDLVTGPVSIFGGDGSFAVYVFAFGIPTYLVGGLYYPSLFITDNLSLQSSASGEITNRVSNSVTGTIFGKSLTMYDYVGNLEGSVTVVNKDSSKAFYGYDGLYNTTTGAYSGNSGSDSGDPGDSGDSGTSGDSGDGGALDSGGLDSGGLDSGGLSSGGLNTGGLSSGGLDSGGLESGGTSSGGLSSGSADSGGLGSGGLTSGGLD